MPDQTEPKRVADLPWPACLAPAELHLAKQGALNFPRALPTFEVRVVMTKASPLGRAVLTQDDVADKCSLT
jgi:hypothetical protein